MIVIAAYNSVDYIENLLNSIRTSMIDEDVLVVCTCPKQTDFIEAMGRHLDTTEYPFKVQHTVTPYSGYDTGAYIWAYQNYKDDYYIFLHDSIVANHDQWFERFKSFRSEEVLNAWCYFGILTAYDPEHTAFFLPKMHEYPIIDDNYPGIFGPMFQISRKALQMIDEKYDLTRFIPTYKNEACAMERGWTYLALGTGIGVNIIDGHYGITPEHYRNMSLTKFLRNRY